jgi:hypothetical protein
MLLTLTNCLIFRLQVADGESEIFPGSSATESQRNPRLQMVA